VLDAAVVAGPGGSPSRALGLILPVKKTGLVEEYDPAVIVSIESVLQSGT
jgi:hypothetical protein